MNSDKTTIRQVYEFAKMTLDELPELPCRIDEMTDREVKITYIACDLCNTLQSIVNDLEPLVERS